MSSAVGGDSPCPSLALLGRFRLRRADHQLDLCRGSQRLVAFLALHRGEVSRDLVAGVLWPDVSERSAHTSLRSALARLTRSAPSIVGADTDAMWLTIDARVDLRDAQMLARGLLGRPEADRLDAAVACIPTLSTPLLPGWYEDWVLHDAEAWHQLRLHALESLAEGLAEFGRYGEALEAAGAAAAGDPLRESPRAALMRIHRAEGNHSEVIREFDRYRQLLRAALGLAPTEGLTSLLSVASG